MPHRCALLGCKNANTGVVMHMFPNPRRFPERFRAWVNLLGEKVEMLSDNDIYIRKRICDVHFTDENRNRYKRLNALAMPTLHLPGNTFAVAAAVPNNATDFEPMVSASTSPLPVAVPGPPSIFICEKTSRTKTDGLNEGTFLTDFREKWLDVDFH